MYKFDKVKSRQFFLNIPSILKDMVIDILTILFSSLEVLVLREESDGVYPPTY